MHWKGLESKCDSSYMFQYEFQDLEICLVIWLIRPNLKADPNTHDIMRTEYGKQHMQYARCKTIENTFVCVSTFRQDPNWKVDIYCIRLDCQQQKRNEILVKLVETSYLKVDINGLATSLRARWSALIHTLSWVSFMLPEFKGLHLCSYDTYKEKWF